MKNKVIKKAVSSDRKQRIKKAVTPYRKWEIKDEKSQMGKATLKAA